MGTITTIWIKEYEKEVWKKFVGLARREGRSASEIIMDFVKDYLARHGEGNPTIPLSKWVENPGLVAFPTLGEPPDVNKLAGMPEAMLHQLKQNAETYTHVAGGLIHAKRVHQTHAEIGVRDGACPYCCEEE